jgi:5-methylcytosine-specific restriction endonuclease McrBC regulatory subunit McrC
MPVSSGIWNLTVDNAVGVIAVDGVEVIVEPKIPLQHLIFLFEKARQLPRLDKRPIDVSRTTTLLELVALWFLRALEALFRDDLLHDYREDHDVLGVLRGSLDVAGTTQLSYSGHPKFSCFFEEYDVDTALNRLLKAGANCVAANGAFPVDLRRRFRLIARRFVGVGSTQHEDFFATTDRRTANYADAATLARLLLRGESRGMENGPRRAWAFLLPTPYAVQEAITKILSEYLWDCSPVYPISVPLGSGLTANPDLLFKTFNAVADVKYKLLEYRWKRADLYQAVAFAAALQSKAASIITFAKDLRNLPPQVHFGEILVTPIAWEADAFIGPEIASLHLCEAVRLWLTS